MKGGQGEGSYVSNSSNQLTYANAKRPMVKDLIKKIFEEKSMEMSKVWRVVDTGCATGANTLVAVNNIISNVMERCNEFHFKPRSFKFSCQILLPMISTLSSVISHPKQTEDESSNAGYYTGIVPGSHYNRLFPTRTINFFHSSISLHWLSRGMIEETLLDKINSPFYFPSMDELHDIVEEEGSFKIIDIKTEKVLHLNQSREKNVDKFVRALQLKVKYLFKIILYSHLGENGLVDELFRRIERWIVRNYFSVVNDMVDIIGLSLIAYATNNVTL